MLYRCAALLGINGAELDRNPLYVVRWMLDAARDEEQASGLDSIDELVAVAQQRERERARRMSDGGP